MSAPIPDMPGTTRPDTLTLLAFGAAVLLIGANPLAVSFTDRAIPPLWGAGTRIGAASLIFFAYVAIRRVPLPRGRDLRGVLLYGIVQFGVGFGLGYWSLVKVPAGVAGVILAVVPLFTLAFAAMARLEPLTLRGVAGALVAVAGIVVLMGARMGGAVPVPYLLAVFGFCACVAAGLVIAKSLPRVHAAAMNAIGMLAGATLLVAASFLLGESKPGPSLTPAWAVQAYVITLGSVGVFGLTLYVVRRWTASGTSYQTVLSPPVTILLASWLLGEPLSSGLVIGAAIVLIGVYIGALWHPRPRDHGVLTPRAHA